MQTSTAVVPTTTSLLKVPIRFRIKGRQRDTNSVIIYPPRSYPCSSACSGTRLARASVPRSSRPPNPAPQQTSIVPGCQLSRMGPDDALLEDAQRILPARQQRQVKRPSGIALWRLQQRCCVVKSIPSEHCEASLSITPLNGSAPEGTFDWKKWDAWHGFRLQAVCPRSACGCTSNSTF